MRSEKGQSTVEFAFVVLILLSLVFGIIDFGRYLHAYLTLDHAAREAARVASLGKDNSEVFNSIDANTVTLRENGILVTTKLVGPIITPANKDDRTHGVDAEITLKYPFSFITPIISNLFSEHIHVETVSVMKVE